MVIQLNSTLIRLATLVLTISYGALLAGQPAWAQNQSVLINELVPIDGESGDIVYSDRVAVAGASVTSLYNRAHRFLAYTLHPGSLVPMAHGAKNHLSQCGIISLLEAKAGHPSARDYRVTVEIKVKAGRYRYRLSQFRAHPHGGGPGVAIRDLYPCDRRTFSYTAVQAQPLQVWHRSVQAYLAQLQRHMNGLEPGLTPL